jgi:hypothetical protein
MTTRDFCDELGFVPAEFSLFSIINTSFKLALCFLCGKVIGFMLRGNTDAWTGDRLANCCHKDASRFLGLTGLRAPSVFFVSALQNSDILVRQIFVDTCGRKTLTVLSVGL